MGIAVGDMLGAVATTSAVPATSSSSKPSKATADGTPVGAQTPRQSLYVSAAYVVAAIAVLLFGSRFFKNARIS